MFDDLTHAKTTSGFNLSRWAIHHGSFTAFLLVLLLAAGAFSLLRIGQKEDPDFTFRVMVVQVLWPGATTEEMQDQVVDKIERKLQETPGLDFVRSYTRPGFGNIFVNLKGAVRGEAVKDAFYQARKKIGDIRQTLPEGVIGPFFNDEFGDTYISLYAVTGDGYSYPELKTFAKNARDILLRVPGVAKVDLLGLQEERIFIEVSSTALAERGLSALDIQAALAGQNAMDPAGRIETSERSVRIDVQGGLRSVEDIRELRLRAGQQTFRLGDIASVRRGLEDPPSAKTSYQGRDAVLLGTTMAPGANVTEVGAEVERALKRIEQDLPIGVELGQISDQAQVVSKSIHEFLEALGEAHRHRARRVVPGARLARRPGRRPDDPDGAGRDVLRHVADGHRPAPHLARRADHRARPAGRRCDDRGRDDGSKARGRARQAERRDLRLHLDRVPDADGHADHGRRLHSGRLRAKPGRRVRQHALLGDGIALMISWFAAVYFTPWIGYRLLQGAQAAKAGDHHEAYDSLAYRVIRALVAWCVRRRKAVVVLTFVALASPASAASLHPQAILPDLQSAGDPGRPLAARRLLLRRDGAGRQTPREAAVAGSRHRLRRRASSAKAHRASICRSTSSSRTRTSPSCC